MKFFLITLCALFLKSSITIAQPIIGYGYSCAVLPAHSQALFLMGFEAGIEKYLGDKKFSDVVMLESRNDDSPLGSIDVATSLLNKGVMSLVGFPTSHEAMLVSKIVRERRVLAIFAGAGHSALGNMGGLVFTTGESMKDSVKVTLDFVLKKVQGGKVAIVTNPFTVFSRNLTESLKSSIQNIKELGGRFKYLQLDKNHQLSVDSLKLLKGGDIDYLLITTYADESAAFMEQLAEHEIDLPFMTNSSWTTGDIEFIRRQIVTKKSPVYSLALWLKGSVESINFEEEIKRKYGREATSEMSYGYDAGVIIGQIFKKAESNLTSQDILDAMHDQRCFSDLSTGTICFDKSGGHAKRKLNLVQITRDGIKLF